MKYFLALKLCWLFCNVSFAQSESLSLDAAEIKNVIQFRFNKYLPEVYFVALPEAGKKTYANPVRAIVVDKVFVNGVEIVSEVSYALLEEEKSVVIDMSEGYFLYKVSLNKLFFESDRKNQEYALTTYKIPNDISDIQISYRIRYIDGTLSEQQILLRGTEINFH